MYYMTNFRFGKSYWVSVSTFFFNLFELIINHLFRSNNDGDGKTDSNSNNFCHEYEEKNLDHPTSLNSNGFSEKEKSEVYFGFESQLGDDLVTKKEETESSVLMGNDINMTINKNAFESAKDIVVFMEAPKVRSFVVQELSDNQNNLNFEDYLKPVIVEEGFNGLKEVSKFSSDDCTEFFGILEKVEKTEDTVFSEEEILEGKEWLNLGENEVSKKEQDNWLADYFLNSENFSSGLLFLSEKEFSSSDSNLRSDDSSYGFSFSSGKVDLGDYDFFKEVNEDEHEKMETYIGNSVEEIKVGFINEVSDIEEIDDGDKEQLNMVDSSEFVKENPVLEEDNMEKSENMWDINMEEEDEYDALLEHIEQMKMNLKKSRNHGLPTILEECETMKISEDLKPLKINEKLEHRDRMGEIQKFYKSYAERMRKMDVLNYQTRKP